MALRLLASDAKLPSIAAALLVALTACPAQAFDLATAGTEGLEPFFDTAGNVVATYRGTTGSYSNDLYLMLDGAGGGLDNSF